VTPGAFRRYGDEVTVDLKTFLIIVAVVGGACVLVPSVIALVTSRRKPKDIRLVAAGMNAAIRMQMAEQRRQRSAGGDRDVNKDGADAMREAEKAFRRVAGNDAIYPRGPEATMLLVSEAVDASRDARRSLLWVGAGTMITTAGSVFAALSMP